MRHRLQTGPHRAAGEGCVHISAPGAGRGSGPPPSVAGMTLSRALAPGDLAPLRVVLAHIDADLADADATLAAASTAQWVSISADLFRGQLEDAQRRIAAVGLAAAGVRAALDRAL